MSEADRRQWLPGIDPDEVLTADEAAALLKTSRDHVSRLARDGSIPATRIGRKWRFTRRALVAMAGGEGGDGDA